MHMPRPSRERLRGGGQHVVISPRNPGHPNPKKITCVKGVGLRTIAIMYFDA